MTISNFISHLYLSLFLHIIIATTLAATDPPPIYTPVEDITVNCGGSGLLFNKYDQRNWNGDISSKFTPIDLHRAAGSNTSMSKEAPRSFSVPQIPYTTVRLSRSEFTYRFNLTAGQKFIRLYFYPVSYPDFDRSEALFSVKAGGFTFLNNFNASVNADADAYEEGTLYREFCINIEEEEQILNITFTPSRSKASPDAYAFINGIEIVSMPPNLYYTAPEHPYGIEIIGTENTIRVENSTAMETVYRINVYGRGLFFNEDTGLYRNWEGYSFELTYLDDASFWSSVQAQNPSLHLEFHLHFAKTPNYSAPEQLYKTGRSMGPDATINQRNNLTWGFPVPPKFYYLVRLHFCEFQAEIREIGDRVFLIYIANQTAETGADIIQWNGGNGIPTYRDYVVFMPSGTGNEEKVFLYVTLQANPQHWKTKYLDAILNGLEIFKLNETNGSLARPDPDPPHPHPQEVSPSSKNLSKSRTHFIAVVAGAVSAALVVFSVLGLLLVFRHRRKYAKGYVHSSRRAANSTKSRGGSTLPSDLCHYFSLKEIKAATENFNDTFIIGVGGFGNVYKGYIDGGATPVAIKRLKPESSQGANEFKTEIEMLSQLRHRHLVSLIGYCTDENEMVLVYDYMSRGTLADNLYHSNNPPLAWGQRLQICIGAARGLHYLHSGAKGTIIHRDVKSTNILLDEKWVAKVSDFGLSKMGMTTASKTHISTMVKGSFGYLDPEYYRRQQLTEKSDVYSFGVVLWEVLCARPALMHKVEPREMNLAEWAKFCHGEGTLDQIIDCNLKGKIDAECLDRFIEIAISCIHDKGVERPSMNEVVRGLEFALQLHQKSIASNGDGGVSTEQGCASNESIQCISATIFSEVDDPKGR
ncbi:receptor-like protein kinase FERONIA isoform X2 [Pyrus x bretschneideri]|uniref:receptor-like protein kinase FERONIA isoform X2 n=1 Tax=Pyrus x bretschneideri TaxID=225117 RepID=UPI00202F4D2D|nr:receptor-like protein kinase FERONIA isoform X2 [Pyrus x bretschneideri]